MDQEKKKTNSNKVKSAVKRNSKFTNSSRDNGKKKKKFIRNNFVKDKKDQFRKDDKNKRSA